MRIKQSANKHQWFVVELTNGVEKIVKVFYSQSKAVEYMALKKKDK